MTLENVNTLLLGLNIDVAYNHFNQKTNPPYVVYYVQASENLFADNRVISENVVLVYKCGQEKLNDLYYEMKEQRRCSTWRKIKNRILRNLSSRSSICIMPEEPRIHNWNVNMA